MKLKITAIKVAEDRQRQDMGDIEELSRSIHQAGLIQPIVVDEDNNLISGERRLRACKRLGHRSIEARQWENLSLSEKHLIELEENVKRKPLKWQEHVEAVKRYHSMRKQDNPNHTEIDTALELGLSPTKLNKDLLIAAEIEEKPELKNYNKYSSVLTKSKREKKRKQALALSGIDIGIGPPKPEVRRAELILGDFRKWAEQYDGPYFDFMHCDFPYGINIDKSGSQLALEHHSQYADSIEVFDELCAVLEEHVDKLLLQDAHIMFWTATKNLSYARAKLFKAGFKSQPAPLIWHKSDGRGVSPDPRYTPRHVYETALFAYRGKRQIGKVKDDVVASPTVNQLHRNEKPKAVLRHFFEMFVDKYTQMLDPTCGCGNSVLIAEEIGAVRAVGLEIDKDIHQVAKENLEL